MKQPRPEAVFDEGLQHERTALAWERTAIATMVAGVSLARFAATELHRGWGALGLLQTLFGGGMLVWAGSLYEELHGVLRDGDPVVRPRATHLVGVVTLATCATALGVGVAAALVN